MKLHYITSITVAGRKYKMRVLVNPDAERPYEDAFRAGVDRLSNLGLTFETAKDFSTHEVAPVSLEQQEVES